MHRNIFIKENMHQNNFSNNNMDQNVVGKVTWTKMSLVKQQSTKCP